MYKTIEQMSYEELNDLFQRIISSGAELYNLKDDVYVAVRVYLTNDGKYHHTVTKCFNDDPSEDYYIDHYTFDDLSDKGVIVHLDEIADELNLRGEM